jgi:hypothetical protein
MPIIPATWEIKIGGLWFQASTIKILSQKNKPHMAMGFCNPSYVRGRDRRIAI